MAAAIRAAHPSAKVVTKPGSKGDFLVTADGKLLWDKRHRDDNEFPTHAQILDQFAAR
ncbi:MAG: hypothetical protein H6838_14320 [Planctomycetes bacterium]|nr:Rdx family protein [Planctomycetota bacterium]MCB9886665.1 hypothetical protein [Planctomycetota bacterium]